MPKETKAGVATVAVAGISASVFATIFANVNAAYVQPWQNKLVCFEATAETNIVGQKWLNFEFAEFI